MLSHLCRLSRSFRRVVASCCVQEKKLIFGIKKNTNPLWKCILCLLYQLFSLNVDDNRYPLSWHMITFLSYLDINVVFGGGGDNACYLWYYFFFKLFSSLTYLDLLQMIDILYSSREKNQTDNFLGKKMHLFINSEYWQMIVMLCF